MASQDDVKTRSGFPLGCLLLCAAGLAIAFFWSRGDLVTASVVAGLSVVGFMGYRTGAIRATGLLGSMIAAPISAIVLGKECEPICQELFSTSGMANRTLGMAVAGFAAVLVINLIAWLVSIVIRNRFPRLAGLDRWLGLGMGVVQGGLLALLGLGGIFVAEPFARQRLNAPSFSGKDEMSRVVATQVVTCAERTRESALGPIVARWNPFERVPFLCRLRDRMTQYHTTHLRGERAFDSTTSDSLEEVIHQMESDPSLRDMLDWSDDEKETVLQFLQKR